MINKTIKVGGQSVTMQQVKDWDDFFSGCLVCIGNGKVAWTVSGVKINNNGGFDPDSKNTFATLDVLLTRKVKHNGLDTGIRRRWAKVDQLKLIK